MTSRAGGTPAAEDPPEASPSRSPRPGAARHIVLVISSLSGGGAERVATALAARWVAGGHRVTLVTVGGRDLDVYPLPAGVERVELGLRRDSKNRLVGMAWALRRARALRRTFARIAPDVAVGFGDRTNVLTLLATMGTGTPTFVSERTDPRVAENAAQWRLARRVLYQRAAGVVVQTESVAAWARERWPRVSVIPNFVDPTAHVASPGATEGPLVLVAMGRLQRVKGFDLLLDAFARVAPAHRAWTLTIYGEGPERAALQAQAERLGLGERLSMPGRIADPAPRLAEGHAFVLSSRREGFPNALVEAMACGLPVVAFDCPSGPAEIVTHGRDGLVVPAGDVAALSAALDRLMGDPAERERLGASARDVTVRYAPDRVLDLWSAILQAGEP